MSDRIRDKDCIVYVHHRSIENMTQEKGEKEMSKKQNNNVTMAKELRPINIWGLAIGAMIGFGCFILPGQQFLPEGGPAGAIGGFLLGAAMVLFIAVSYSFLIAKFPISGGEYVYTYASFGKKPAFLCGWFLLIAYWALVPMNGTAIGLIGRYLFPGVLQGKLLYNVAGWDVYSGEIIVSLIAILLVGFINLRGVSVTGWFQTAVAFGLVGSVLFILSAALVTGPDFSNLKPAFPDGVSGISALLTITAIAPFLYIGFDCIPQAAEEYSFSHKKTLGLIISSTILASLMYTAITFVTALVYPWQEFLNSKPDWATGTAVEVFAGQTGLVFLGIAMFCAVVSGMNAFYLSGSRLLYAMGESDAVPPVFGYIHPKTRVPSYAILFLLVFSLVAPFFGRVVLGWLVDMTAVGAAMGYFFTTASAAKIAKAENNTRQMVIARFGAFFSAVFIALLVLPFSPGSLTLPSWIWLVVWLVMGILFFRHQWPIFKNSTRLDEEVEMMKALERELE